MLKYIYTAHKPLVIITLLDMLFIGLAALVVYYINVIDPNLYLPTTISYLIYYLLKYQPVIFFGITGYLFTGQRLLQTIRHIGKNKTFILQSASLLSILIFGSIRTIFLINWPLTSTSFLMYGFITPWFIFIATLLSYQLLNYSKLKYSTILFKSVTTISLFISALIFSRGLNLALYAYFDLNQYLLTEAADAITPINLTSLAPYNQLALLFTVLTIITLTISLVQYLGIKKVGQS